MSKKGWKTKVAIAVLISVLTVILLSSAFSFAGEKYPNKPIVLIIPYGPGGGSDCLARTLQSVTPEYLGVVFKIRLRPGATGSIGVGEAAKAKPDGYTLVIYGQSETSTLPHFRKVPYSIDDFDVICQLSELPQGFSVYKGHPWKSVDEVVAYAKKNPGKLKISHSGTGGLAYAQVLQFELAAGVEVEDVPFKGMGPASVGAGGGHVDAVMGSFAGQRAQIQAGNLRPLACSSSERDPLNKDIPTFRELGYDIVMNNLQLIAGPRGIPRERINILSEAFHKTYKNRSWQSLAKKLMLKTNWRGPDEAQQAIRDEFNKVGKLVERIKKQKK